MTILGLYEIDAVLYSPAILIIGLRRIRHAVFFTDCKTTWHSLENFKCAL
jgi:hypothetical protein